MNSTNLPDHPIIHCLNCNAVMHGPVCSNCGQKEAKPLVTQRVAGDIWQQFLDLDYRLIRSLKELLLSPGNMINHYLAGQRINYTNPFKLLFIVATMYFLVIQFFEIDVDPFTDSNTANTVAAFLNYLVFLFLLPTALLFRWIFGRTKINYAESYVALSFIWSGYLLLVIVLALVTIPISKYFIILRMIFGLLYIIYVSKQMFLLKIRTAFWKSTLLYICYVFFTMLIVSLIITIAHLVGYEPLMLEFKRG